MRRVNLILDEETLAVLDRMARATESGASMNRSSLVRALVKGAAVLPAPLFRLQAGEEGLTFLVRSYLTPLAQRANEADGGNADRV